MAKKRANGEGSIRKRRDGRWEGRYTVGYDENGKVKMKNVLGKTQAEVKEKLKEKIEESQFCHWQPPSRGLFLFALFHRLTRKRVGEFFQTYLVI